MVINQAPLVTGLACLASFYTCCLPAQEWGLRFVMTLLFPK